jgi:putative drug exporter of the RND superfamily
MDRNAAYARLVSGRRSKWVVLAVWLVLTMAVAGPLAGKLTGEQRNELAQWLPGEAEATQVVELQQKFQSDEIAPAVIVYARTSGITPADQAKAAADARAFASVDGVTGQITGPLPAADGQALQTVVPITMSDDGWNKIVDRVTTLQDITGSGTGGLSVQVTGPAGYNADNARAFAGIDSTLLLATILVVTVILLFAYRSPVLWLLPVICAGLALTAAQAFIYLLAAGAGLTVNAQSAGILMVLVFGAGTDYALLLIARYREELRRHEDRHEAMAIALRRAAPAIIASAATVAAGLLCLLVADMNNTRGLGPVLAIGVAVALVTTITLLPALLVICGRWIFWPKKPRVGSTAPTGRSWTRLGEGIARRPRTVWIGTVLVFAGLALGVTKLDASGLAATDSFTNTPESVAGQETLNQHFPAGQNGQPVVVIGKSAAAEPLRQAIAGTSGIANVGQPVVRGDLVSYEGTLQAQPDSQAAKDTVERLRTAVHAVPGADAKVGGQTALTMDMNEATAHDNKLIIPLVLAAILVILCLLLRSLVAPLVLIATVVLSFAAALGVSAIVFDALGFAGSDSAFPLFIFVFLVALGVDYNIFLMTRVREEAQRHGTRRGALVALSATGGVITSAGLVLAATFAVFVSVPVVFFAELGIAVALGVLLDTFVVRSVLVIALTLDIGPKIWAPSALASRPEEPAEQPPSPAPEPVRTG